MIKLKKGHLWVFALIILTLSTIFLAYQYYQRVNTSPLEAVLMQAGDNRKELEKVLEYYKHNTLKLRGS